MVSDSGRVSGFKRALADNGFPRGSVCEGGWGFGVVCGR